VALGRGPHVTDFGSSSQRSKSGALGFSVTTAITQATADFPPSSWKNR